MRKLGIIAGSGMLPLELIQTCQKQGRPYCVVAIKGHAEAACGQGKNGAYWCRLGAAGKVLKFFRKQQVQDVVMIGGIRRPSLWELWPDWLALKSLWRIRKASFGDNGLLSWLAGEVEALGFHLVGVHQVLPKLLLPKGVLGSVAPTAGEKRDVAHGVHVAKILGQADVGQGVIVQQGLVLAVEGIEGTDAMIRRTAGLKRKGPSGVLVKMMKPGQDKRLDLPTIGPRTIQTLADSGFKGVAAEAGLTLLAEAEKTIALADKLGIFIMGVDA